MSLTSTAEPSHRAPDHPAVPTSRPEIETPARELPGGDDGLGFADSVHWTASVAAPVLAAVPAAVRPVGRCGRRRHRRRTPRAVRAEAVDRLGTPQPDGPRRPGP